MYLALILKKQLCKLGFCGEQFMYRTLECGKFSGCYLPITGDLTLECCVARFSITRTGLIWSSKKNRFMKIHEKSSYGVSRYWLIHNGFREMPFWRLVFRSVAKLGIYFLVPELDLGEISKLIQLSWGDLVRRQFRRLGFPVQILNPAANLLCVQ